MTESPSARTPVLLHIGAGSFHRAHQAWYLHRVNAAVPADERWSLTVGNIRDDMHATMDALAAQHGAYTLETVTPQGERAYETIRAITRVLPWSIDLAALIDAGTDPACRLVPLPRAATTSTNTTGSTSRTPISRPTCRAHARRCTAHSPRCSPSA
jgi:D-arabinitol 4-dehydrogenase